MNSELRTSLIQGVLGVAVFFVQSVLGVAVLTLFPFAPLAALEETPAPPSRSVRIPVENGQVDLGSILAVLVEAVLVEEGLAGDLLRESITWRVQVDGTRGRLRLYGIQLATLGCVRFDREGDVLVTTVDLAKVHKNEKKLRRRVLGILTSLFPAAAAREAANYGMFTPGADGSHEPISKEAISKGSVAKGTLVVLVHGINDLRRNWKTLIPRLKKAGHSVCVFRYPNDQAIEDSAVFLGRELARLKTLGVNRVRFVAHSMGGLVCRELLTSSALYGGKGEGHDAFPGVDRLIMIATPNHGSELARYHLLGEWVDQLNRQLAGDGRLLSGFFDGTGEAQVDLLPDSHFLRRLNARPHPGDVAYTIIAGKGIVGSAQIVRETDRIVKSVFGSKPELMEKYGNLARGLLKSLDQLSGKDGDWAVAVDSARIPGVDDFHVFQGNHFSLIRNVLDKSARTPPAIPVILERLKDSESKSESELRSQSSDL